MNKIELKKYIEEKILTKDLKIKSVAIRWGYLDNIKNELNSFIKNGDSLQEKLYLFYFNKQKPKCKSCGKELKFESFSRPYNTWCSNKCSSSDPDILKESKIKRLNKYGSYNNYNKIKQTNMKRYGVENPSQRQDIKEKKKQAMINNFGVKYPMQSKIVKQHLRENNLEKYGVENVSQLNKVKEKKKQTMIKNYGVDNPMQSSIIRKKIEETCLNNYGVKHPLQIPEIHKKVLQANGRKNKLKELTEDLHYQTQPELECILHCQNNNIDVKDGPSIKYILDGKEHIYHIDFETNENLIEIKGDHHWYQQALKSGELEAKNKAAQIFATSVGKEFKFLFNENNDLNKFKDIIKENING